MEASESCAIDARINPAEKTSRLKIREPYLVKSQERVCLPIISPSYGDILPGEKRIQWKTNDESQKYDRWSRRSR